SQGAHETGFLSACVAVIALMNVALAGVLNVMTPALAHSYAMDGIAALRGRVWESCCRYVGLAILLSVVPILFGESIVNFAYGSDFSGTRSIVCTLAVNAIFRAVSGCIGRGLMVMGYAKWDFALNLAARMLPFAFGWWCINAFGALGAAA